MKIIRYIFVSLQMKIRNHKTLAFAAIILFLCLKYTHPLFRFVQDAAYPVTWCIFPFLMTSHVFLILYLFGIIYMNTDAPFMQYVNMYQIIRTGRKVWVAGQAAGIIVRSFAATAVTALFCCIPFLGQIEWTNEWGRVFRTIAISDIPGIYGFDFFINYEIFDRFTPVQLLLLSVLIVSLLSSFMGVLMFLMSLYINRIAGVVINIILSLGIFFVLNIELSIRKKAAMFVPTIWAQIARMATPSMGYYWMPSIKYITVVLLILNMICIFLCISKVKRIEFDWVVEDS